MPTNHRQFAVFITDRRKELGLTQPELAQQIGVAKSNVFWWESGEGLPAVDSLERLARALKVSYEDLFVAAGYAHSKAPLAPATYMRSLYDGISKKDLAEAERLFGVFDARYHRAGTGTKRKRRRR